MNKYFSFFILSVLSVSLMVCGLPLDTEYSIPENSVEFTTENSLNDTKNGTHKELIVIKVVTYEVGILADIPDDDNATEDGPLTHQQVDLTFYNAQGNDSFIDFGTIPLPVQTNVSGQIVTGLAPVDIGAHNIENVGNILNSIPVTGTIVSITNSDTSYINLSRENVSLADQLIPVNSSDSLAQLPILNNILLPDNFNDVIDNTEP